MLTLDTLLKWGKVKRNQIQLVLDRGYEISEIDKLYFTSSVDKVGISLYCRAKKQGMSLGEVSSDIYTKQSTKLMVHYTDYNYDFVLKCKKNTSLNQLKQALLDMSKNECTDCLIISPTSISSKGQALIKHCQLLTHSQLSYVVVNHELVPYHYGCSVQEEQEYLTTNKFSKKDLPVLKVSDPVSNYYGFKPGQLVKIKRGNSVFVRVVE
jgi:DNA-directed RNA polymerase I, II, and III subunit RPABC1